ncbi:hypothetical protein [Streptomyces sp. NPDC050504]|uniref:hypothetical protein n=1 Tax=Streptomyces sp. NPDC050504 TaxID=3365618 RepID=UPI003799B4D3
MEFSEGLEINTFQGNWLVRMWWPPGAVAGGPQKIVVEAAPDAPPAEAARGISTTVLRRLDISEAVRRAQRLAPETEPWRVETERLEREAGRTARLLGDTGVSEPYLARLCELYLDLARKGVPAPVPWLAERLERSPQTVRDHLKAARREGYMTALTGKAGGELTAKALAVLGEGGTAGAAE